MTRREEDSVSLTDVPEWLGVSRHRWNQQLQVLQYEILQEGAPVELVSLDVVDSVAPLAHDNIVEEDVLGNAEISAVGEEVVPGGPTEPAIELPEVDPGEELPEETRHEDVVEPGGLHESRGVLH